MVCILPQPQAREDSVFAINHAVTIAAVRYLVIFSECEESVRLTRRRLWGEVAKQFLTVIYCIVPVTVKGKPRIIRACAGPCPPVRRAVAVEIEHDPVCAVCQVEAVAFYVNQDWTTITDASTP